MAREPGDVVQSSGFSTGLGICGRLWPSLPWAVGLSLFQGLAKKPKSEARVSHGSVWLPYAFVSTLPEDTIVTGGGPREAE